MSSAGVKDSWVEKVVAGVQVEAEGRCRQPPHEGTSRSMPCRRKGSRTPHTTGMPHSSCRAHSSQSVPGSPSKSCPKGTAVSSRGQGSSPACTRRTEGEAQVERKTR